MQLFYILNHFLIFELACQTQFADLSMVYKARPRRYWLVGSEYLGRMRRLRFSEDDVLNPQEWARSYF